MTAIVRGLADHIQQQKRQEAATGRVEMKMDHEQLQAEIDKNRPRPYNLDDPAELLRLYRETHGYLRICHHEHGTDWEGRKFAIDALSALSKWP